MVPTVFDMFLRMLVAAALGLIIGLEREYRAKEAGYRTHFLVSLGSALMMLVSQYGFMEIIRADGVSVDPSRIASQIVSGIGFIGVGTIILQKQVVRGLTTAAGIWATAGIGMAIGAGMYAAGTLATVLTLVGLEALGVVFKSFGMRTSHIELTTEHKESLKEITRWFYARQYRIVTYEVREQVLNGQSTYQVSMVIKNTRKSDDEFLLDLLKNFDDVNIHLVE